MLVLSLRLRRRLLSHESATSAQTAEADSARRAEVSPQPRRAKTVLGCWAGGHLLLVLELLLQVVEIGGAAWGVLLLVSSCL